MRSPGSTYKIREGRPRLEDVDEEDSALSFSWRL